MACFIVPATQAIVVSVAAAIIKKKEKEPQAVEINGLDGKIETAKRTSFSKKLNWLSYLLFGGSVLLAFEHLWHGEVVPWFPFLTGGEASSMLHEMATTGVTMAVLCTIVWVGMVIVSSIIEKRAIIRTVEVTE